MNSRISWHPRCVSCTRTRPAFGRSDWLTAAIISIGLTPALQAQMTQSANDGGPLVFEQEERHFETFSLTRINAAIEFLARRRIDQQRESDGTRTRDVEDTLLGVLELEAQAFIMHPNFIDLSLLGRLRLEDEDINSESVGLDERSITFDNQYDASAIIFKETDLPFTVYSRRFQTTIDRQFADSLDSVNTEHGAILRVVHDVFPSTFQVFHREQEQLNQGGVVDYGLTQDTFDFQSNFRMSHAQDVQIEYTYDNVEETGEVRADNKFARHDFTGTHNWQFGDLLSQFPPHRLRSRLHVMDRSGRTEMRRMRFDQNLLLTHSEWLKTQYTMLLEKQNRSASATTTSQGTAQFRHQLYDSLNTVGTIGFSRQGFGEGFRSDEYTADLTFDYRKIVPKGLLNSTLSLSFSERENTKQGSNLDIFDEQRTFQDPFPIILTRRNLIASSIVITDLAGFKTYIEGADYFVDEFPDRVELSRIIGGDIVDGESVLLDYTIGPEPANTLTSNGLSWTGRYDFDEGALRGLGLYSQFRLFERDIDSPNPSLFVVDDTTDLVLGVDYRWEDFFFEVEYEKFDSDISPFDAKRFEARYVRRGGGGSSLSLDGRYYMLHYPDTNNDIDLMYVTGQLRQRLSAKLTASVRVIWRNERDRLGGNSQGFEQHLNLRWRHRQTDIYLEARNADLDSDRSSNRNQVLAVGVRRTF